MNPSATPPGKSNYVDPTPIMELATAYWASATLLAANELGIFSPLARGPKPLDALAADLHADPRGLRLLLDACCGLGLLKHTPDGYALTPASAQYLVPGKPGTLGTAISWAQDQYAMWGRLAHSVRTGLPAAAPAEHLGTDPQQTRTFVLAMRERALGMARAVVRFMDLEECRRLLDVGGGPGAYARLLVEQYPKLHVTILDLPGVAAIAQELIAEDGLAHRITVMPGDATLGEYGAGHYDAVLFSGVLHQMSEQNVRKMLGGAHRSLTAGGRVVVSDVMLDETRSQPAFAALFSLQMLLSTAEGQVFTEGDLACWLEAAGFRNISVRRLPPPLPYTVVHAAKP
ncbi:MAG: methyltransferase [Chthonomonadales bacterium]